MQTAADPGAREDGGAVVLFDGVCNLCNGSVQFIVRHDPAGRFRFASLQSEAGRALLRRHGLDPEDLFSVILVEDGRAHSRSDAALRIAGGLSGGWRAAGGLRVVPRPLRDLVYGWVARNRYRWFGRRDACMIPTPELRGRFLG
ncbi:MAG TPA: thiol-disulfide oxidoreductase DCC family protein [Longimicrobiaceae bacterium]|nr:thiol-disulfide oxidoreductase DCC family protein [Longimicrobiaceae bacterium]